MAIQSMARPTRDPRPMRQRGELVPLYMRSLMILSFFAVVLVFTTVQFAPLTEISLSVEDTSTSSHQEGFASPSPIEQILREQRQQHQEHAKQQQQQSERDVGVHDKVVREQESKQAQKDPQSSNRRRLRSSHEIKTAHEIHPNPAEKRIIRKVNGVTVYPPVRTRTGKQAHQDPDQTTLTRTTRATRKEKNPAPPWKFKRSIPRPPSDFQSDTTPLDPLRPDFNLTALTPLNYTLRSKYHGLLLDGGRHYFQIDWIKRMINVSVTWYMEHAA
jgi:hypothetical protein